MLRNRKCFYGKNFTQPERILITLSSRMNHFLDAIEYLRGKFPHSKFTVIGHKRFKDKLPNFKEVDEYIEYEENLFDIFKFGLKKIKTLRKKCDAFILLYNNPQGRGYFHFNLLGALICAKRKEAYLSDGNIILLRPIESIIHEFLHSLCLHSLCMCFLKLLTFCSYCFLWILDLPKTINNLFKKERTITANIGDIVFHNFRFGREYIQGGVHFTRCIEYPHSINLLSLKKGMRLLDIGSGEDSIFPLYLAKEGVSVFATDYMETILNQYNLAKRVGLGYLIPSGLLKAEVQDARSLGYPDEFFDAVSAISSIEHIPRDGDSLALREMGRVLKRGGRLVLSVPFSRKYSEGFIDGKGGRVYSVNEVNTEEDRYGMTISTDDGKLEGYYFQRNYDRDSLYNRLIKPSGLKIEKIDFFREKYFHFYNIWLKFPPIIRYLFVWIVPIYARFSLINVQKEKDLKYSCLVILTLKKVIEK